MKGVFTVGFVVIAFIQLALAIMQSSGKRLHIDEYARRTFVRCFRRVRKALWAVSALYLVAVLCVVFFTDVRAFFFDIISTKSIAAIRSLMNAVFGTTSVRALLGIMIIGAVWVGAFFVALAILCCLVVASVVPYVAEERGECDYRENDEAPKENIIAEKLFLKNLRMNN